MVFLKKSGGVRFTVNYKKLNQINKLSQLSIPRVDQVLDFMGSGRVLSLFDLVSSFHQIMAHKNTVPFTAFCTPTAIYEWLVMLQGSSASPECFGKVINKVTTYRRKPGGSIPQVAVFYVIAYDSEPIEHAQTIRSLFERLRKYNLKFPPKARLGATDANRLGHSISSVAIHPNAKNVSALITMPMPTDVKQVRALMGGSILVFPSWNAVADGSRPFNVYCDACIDELGAAFEQEQAYGPMKPIAYTSRATLDSESQWTPLDLEAGSIVSGLKRLRGHLCGTMFRIFSDHNELESIGKVGNHCAQVQGWLEFLTALRLHTRVPQRKCERQRRPPVPLARACHGT